MSDQITIGHMDVDSQPNTGVKYGIRGLPTLLLFSGGELKSTKVGLTNKADLMAWIKESISS